MITEQSDDLTKALGVVRERFLYDLDQRICDFEHLKGLIETGSNRTDAIRAVAMVAHKIRGVAPTLGLARMGALAGSLEDLIANPAAAWRDAAPVLETLLDEMERVQPDYSVGCPHPNG